MHDAVAVLLDSEALASDLAQRMERDLASDRSWRVIMRPGSRELTRSGERDGKPIVATNEPDASLFWRSWVRIARQFPFIKRLL